MEENLRLLRERKAGYGEHLLGEEIFAFRRKYGLSQQAAAKVFGKGKIAFSRYENEKTFPDDSARKLFQMAMHFPEVLKKLADDAGVEIPLWGMRLADSYAQKVRVMRVISRVEQELDLEPAEPDAPAPQAAVA